jgi:hypothetical protein
MKLMLTFVIVCYAFFAQAQHAFDWSKYDNFPFNKDNESLPTFWGFEKDVLTSIKESKADVEIRGYFFHHLGERTILTMQCFVDSLICKILYRTVSMNAPLPVSKADSILYENGGNYYNWHIEEFVVNKKAGHVMDELIQKGLFISHNASGDSIKDALRRKYANYNNCDSLKTAVRYSFNDTVRYSFNDTYSTWGIMKLNNRYKTLISREIRYSDENIHWEWVSLGSELLKAFKSYFNEKIITSTYDIECRSTEF